MKEATMMARKKITSLMLDEKHFKWIEKQKNEDPEFSFGRWVRQQINDKMNEGE